MWESIMKFFRKITNKEDQASTSKDAAKERLHLVLMQDRANVSADFLELMKQEIIEVIKKYIDVDENAIDVRLTNKENVDGTKGAPALYANIPIINLKNEVRQIVKNETEKVEEDIAPKNIENAEEKAEEENNKGDTLQEETETDAEKIEESEETNYEDQNEKDKQETVQNAEN